MQIIVCGWSSADSEDTKMSPSKKKKKKSSERARVSKVIQKSNTLNTLHLFLPTGLAADHLAALRVQGLNCSLAGFTDTADIQQIQLTE